MVRPVHLVVLLAVLLSAVVALAAPGTASARNTPSAPRLYRWCRHRRPDERCDVAELAHLGAVGLMRPGYGPRPEPPPCPGQARARDEEVDAQARRSPGRQTADQHEQGQLLPELQDVHRRPAAAARRADFERPPLSRRSHRRWVPRAARIHHAHSGPGLDSGHRPDDAAGTPDDDAFLDAVEGRARPAVEARSRDQREQSAQVRHPLVLAGVLLALALLGMRAAPARRSPPRCSSTSVSDASLERGAAVRRALPRERRSWRSSSRASVAASRGAPCALRRRGRPLRLRDGRAGTRVAGGEPVRADAELAVLGDRQSDRDAAARAAPGGRPRAKALRDRGLRRVRRLGARRDDGQPPAGLRRRRCDRARRRARGAGGATVQARSARLRRSARVRGSRRALDRLAGPRAPGPNHLRSAFADHSTGLVSSLESRVPLWSSAPRIGKWSFLFCSCSPSPLRSRGVSRVDHGQRRPARSALRS